MNKIVIFLQKYAIYFNLFSIIFWLFIIFLNYENEKNVLVGKNIIPAMFILLSLFNIYAARRRKEKTR